MGKKCSKGSNSNDVFKLDSLDCVRWIYLACLCCIYKNYLTIIIGDMYNNNRDALAE